MDGFVFINDTYYPISSIESIEENYNLGDNKTEWRLKFKKRKNMVLLDNDNDIDSIMYEINRPKEIQEKKLKTLKKLNKTLISIKEKLDEK